MTTIVLFRRQFSEFKDVRYHQLEVTFFTNLDNLLFLDIYFVFDREFVMFEDLT